MRDIDQRLDGDRRGAVPSYSHSHDVTKAVIDLGNTLVGQGLLSDATTPEVIVVSAHDAVDVAALANRVFSRFGDWSLPFQPSESDGVIRLAQLSRNILRLVAENSVSLAVVALNDLFREQPVILHMSLEAPWSLHHHDPAHAAVQGWRIGALAAIGDLISSGGWNRIGVCAGADCNNLFLDDTKNRSQRFCSYACQNRAKVRAYRLRQREERVRRVGR
ncbi:CGNR zinc finger domain-containing protein [Pseudoclavibacter sp. CFCC 11306]|uniref:CGNR zinc finger domain-containing protein n=1 Tax=Pseudoclavibacter sp. CFCC 11306 TaxID=1564493 RepID=UPI001787A014|nr:CGNR zinc finger domain-containing protein [Pseudoclavibacter sp. CFCC 11306]